MLRSLVGSEMCIRDRSRTRLHSFMESVPVGAGQFGWASPGELKYYNDGLQGYQQYKVLVRYQLEKSVQINELTQVCRSSAQQLCHSEDEQHRATRALARKYEVARFGQREFSAAEFKEILRLPVMQWRTNLNTSAKRIGASFG
eukprot:TRINITY_DN24310_c0_g1_i4.p1 TRINITY_DN24310_c0_g1~~TRINITY_DN24310_c0_g1_i4.p1  ORF type:complete len:144 (+),score=17.58 TRINITY_DN24310_c0_g1_i4:83-514(+)